MRRRNYLSLLAAAIWPGIAGCGTTVERPTATLAMTEYADATVLPRIMQSVGLEDGMRERRKTFADILDGGANLTGTSPPFREVRPVYFNETVYTLSHEITERTPATGYSIRIEVVDETVTGAETVRFSELPKVDRRTLANLGFADGDVIGVGTSVLYTNNQSNRSALVSQPTTPVIVWENGSRARWVVERAYEMPIFTFSYSAEVVASAAAYREQLLAEFAFHLTGLPESQRGILETAIDEGEYRVPPEETPSPAFVSLVERFRPWERVRPLDGEPEEGIGGNYVVRYEGTPYWTSLVLDDEDTFRDGFESTQSKATTTS